MYLFPEYAELVIRRFDGEPQLFESESDELSRRNAAGCCNEINIAIQKLICEAVSLSEVIITSFAAVIEDLMLPMDSDAADFLLFLLSVKYETLMTATYGLFRLGGLKGMRSKFELNAIVFRNFDILVLGGAWVDFNKKKARLGTPQNSATIVTTGSVSKLRSASYKKLKKVIAFQTETINDLKDVILDDASQMRNLENEISGNVEYIDGLVSKISVNKNEVSTVHDENIRSTMALVEDHEIELLGLQEEIRVKEALYGSEIMALKNIMKEKATIIKNQKISNTMRLNKHNNDKGNNDDDDNDNEESSTFKNSKDKSRAVKAVRDRLNIESRGNNENK